MDPIDRKIVAELQLNARQKMADLSEKVGLSPTPCARRVSILEDAGVITGYSARVNQTKLGLPITIFVTVELERQASDAIAAFERSVQAFDEVMECYLMTGSRDILLRVVSRDLTSFDEFLEHHLLRVPGIRSTQSSFTLRTMIQRNTLPSG
ncbi:Lrp/AsnC family transcriptional regulator [Parasedimentitalea marina]|uniref:Lrp/AsnC family transcriptional regulator n=1 Tax=Parasedimentitalea marina TaxID=2483033 RepID=A0A3T0N0Y1_9RHOB|nr:Lrp/AsnC family transcriptional regulator [Parasedimentitalea marina]AZV77673.1 Lrp/AsnC family transcriptional regulator [Parasedimentitalea marina]